MSAYSEYEAGYDAALEAVADGEVDAVKVVEEERAATSRASKRGATPAISRGELDNARLTVAELAVRGTNSDAEAVEATREVFDMLGIGGAR